MAKKNPHSWFHAQLDLWKQIHAADDTSKEQTNTALSLRASVAVRVGRNTGVDWLTGSHLLTHLLQC